MSITTPPKDFAVMFLDMNSFFATVEQQVQPTLRGLPVGVAPYTGSSGCIIAASREAKKRGVKICRVDEARRLCPNIKILEARPALYMIYHKEIRRVIEKFTPYFKALSIDEFAIQLTPMDQNYAGSVKLAKRIKAAIREEVGDYMSCSIGIGPNVFLAKMAGERHKPDGLTVVTLNDLHEFFANPDLKLTDITGINTRMQARLNFLGVQSPLDFFNLSLSTLMQKMQHMGRLWYFRLRGYEVDEHVVKNKTIGHSHVLAPEFRSKNGAMAILRKLISKTAVRVRKEGYCIGGLTVNINFINQSNFHLSRRVPSFSDNQTFFDTVLSMVDGCDWSRQPIYISISTFNLTKAGSEQISLFEDIERSRNLSKTLDSINDDFGVGTIIPASLMGTKDAAPDRIPFGMPRYEILN
ncbi:MAG: hypothetical protein WCO23_04855 [bacterium]